MGWFGTAVSWSQRRGWKIPFFLAGAPLSVSEEHGYKRPQFASWVTACLVSPNFASLPLNYLQNNAQTNLHCGKTLDHKCEHTFISFLVFNLDQHFDGICKFAASKAEWKIRVHRLSCFVLLHLSMRNLLHFQNCGILSKLERENAYKIWKYIIHQKNKHFTVCDYQQHQQHR